jgi:hypothetical protein
VPSTFVCCVYFTNLVDIGNFALATTTMAVVYLLHYQLFGCQGSKSIFTCDHHFLGVNAVRA